MSYTPNITTAPGGVTDFAVTFPYLRQAHVKVKVDGTDTTKTWANAGTVRIIPAPSTGAVVEVYRDTPSVPISTLQNNKPIPAATYNELVKQTLYFAEEQAYVTFRDTMASAALVQELAEEVEEAAEQTAVDRVAVASDRALSAGYMQVTEAAAVEAAASAASINLPAISPGDGGRTLAVKSDLTGYEHVPLAAMGVISVNGKGEAHVVLGAADVLTVEGASVEDQLDDLDGRMVDVEAASGDHEGRLEALESAPPASSGAVRTIKQTVVQGATWSNIASTPVKATPVTIQSQSGRYIRVNLLAASITGAGGSGSGTNSYELGLFRDDEAASLMPLMAGTSVNSASGPQIVNLAAGFFVPVVAVIPITDSSAHTYTVGLYRSSGSDNTRDFSVTLHVLFEELEITP